MDSFLNWLYPANWWTTIVPTSLWEVRVEEWNDWNTSQRAAISIDMFHALMLGLLEESELTLLKQQQLNSKINNYKESCGNYLKAVLDNDSNQMEYWSRLVNQTEWEILELWQDIKNLWECATRTKHQIILANHEDTLS